MFEHGRPFSSVERMVVRESKWVNWYIYKGHGPCRFQFVSMSSQVLKFMCPILRGDICPGFAPIVSSHRKAEDECPDAMSKSKIAACVEAVTPRLH